MATGRAAVVVAAGGGQRLGAGMAKALVRLGGRTLLARSVAAFVGAVEEVVVVAPIGAEDAAHAEAARAGFPAAVVCPGGGRRQDSVRHGLAACSAAADVIAVHDAARALISHELVIRTFDALTVAWDAVAPAIEVADTLKEVDGEQVRRTLDRSLIRAVQTPQVFRAEVLRRAHAVHGGGEATDDLALVEAAGGRVRLIPGERRNLKITHPEDLAMAEILLREDGS